MTLWTPPANPTPADWARMAAYIDGEGLIGIRCRKPSISKSKNSNRNHVVVVVVGNTDPRLIIWIKKTFNTGFISIVNASKTGRKPAYIWECYSKVAEWILRGCFEYFVIKQDQADICFQLRNSMMPSDIGRMEKGLPDGVLNIRDGLKARLHALKAATPKVPNELQHLLREVS